MKPHLLLLGLAVACTSCYHVYYAPNTANAPLLSEKGETRVNALYCSGGDSEFDGGELQAACAVSKNIGVMVNFFGAGKSEDVYNYSTDRYRYEKGKGTYIEFAGGYFQRLGKSRWIGEVYGGPGFGSVTNEYGDGDHSKVGIVKFFIQPAAGYKVKHFEFVIAPKLSFVSWKIKENEIFSVGNEGFRNDMARISNKRNFLAFEPALIARAGGSDFKFQAALSFSAYGRSEAESLREGLNASIGISLDIK